MGHPEGESSRAGGKKGKRERQAIQAALQERPPSAVRLSEGDSNDSPRTATSQIPTHTHGEQTTTAEKKKVRRKSVLMAIAKTQADLIRVEIDAEGKACGEGQVRYNSALPQIARLMVPITIPSWDHVSEQMRADLWDAVKMRFDVEDRAYYRALQKMGIAWRNYKSKITNEILEAGNNSRTLEFLKPLNVPNLEEWMRFATQRLSQQHAKERQQKQELQARNKYPHTMSRRGYDGTRREMEKKSDTPEAISRVDVWIEGHRRKDGSFVNETSREAAESMEQYTQTTQSSGIRDDALAAVIGPEHRGRVRGLGFGATLRQVNKESGSSQKYDVKFAAMERELQEQRQKQAEMMRMLELALANAKSSPTAPPQVSPESEIENVEKKCQLLHYNGKDSVVASGEISSTDPNDEIGGAAIGEECWSVWILDVYGLDVHLYRSQSPYCLLREVLGKVIAWPKKFIKITD